MLSKTPIGNRFYNWVNSQDPKRRYEWHNNCGCACGRFLIEGMGLERDEVQGSLAAVNFPSMLTHNNKDAVEVWRLFNSIAHGGGNKHVSSITKLPDKKGWTFGKLAQRIREQMPEYVD
jgi:hypothetical protein